MKIRNHSHFMVFWSLKIWLDIFDQKFQEPCEQTYLVKGELGEGGGRGSLPLLGGPALDQFPEHSPGSCGLSWGWESFPVPEAVDSTVSLTFVGGAGLWTEWPPAGPAFLCDNPWLNLLTLRYSLVFNTLSMFLCPHWENPLEDNGDLSLVSSELIQAFLLFWL